MSRIDRLSDEAEDRIGRMLASKRFESFLKGFCWGVITVAGLYFAPVIINIITR